MTRTRRIEGGLEERLTIVNYSATAQPIDIELAIGVDMADIFEVRGYRRASRGALLLIVLEGDRAVFAYDGLDDVRRSTTVCAESGGRLGPVIDPDAFPGATVQLTWDGILAPGARMTVGWRVEEMAARSLTSGGPLSEMGVVTTAPAPVERHERGKSRAKCRAGGAPSHTDDLDRQPPSRRDDRALLRRPRAASKRRTVAR